MPENSNNLGLKTHPLDRFGSIFGVRLPSGRLQDLSRVQGNLKTALLVGDFRIWESFGVVLRGKRVQFLLGFLDPSDC